MAMEKVEASVVIREVPGVQAVVLPADWFDTIRDDKPVYTSLYYWMVESAGVPSDSTLPGRTYVGEKLAARVRTAERRRIARTSGYKGSDLDDAVNWSLGMYGPKEEIGDLKLKGDVILVIPEPSRKALDEFATRLWRTHRKVTVEKIRRSAAGATFYQWLICQGGRPDRVGSLAKEAMSDESFPKESNDCQEIRRYLGEEWADSAAGSFKDAWLEYLKQYPERVQPAAWCGRCEKKIDVDEGFLAWYEDELEFFIFDSACLAKHQGSDEMVSRSLSEISAADLEQFREIEDINLFEVDRLEENLKLWGVIPPDQDGIVYFVQSRKTYEIKIGFTTRQVDTRRRGLQTANPGKLEVIATLPGSREYENALHVRFAQHKLEGEWFEPHPDLLAFISTLQRME
jgi:uncharacterized protein YozE (UPF0346 family)